jgi:lipoprotein-anchoring transpeptidase ErfK/SrfK
MKPFLLPCLFYTASSLMMSSAQAEPIFNEPPVVTQEPESTGSTQSRVINSNTTGSIQRPATRPGQYGGGFIEFLMTGNSNGNVQQPVRAQAQLQQVQINQGQATSPSLSQAPLVMQRRTHLAALPASIASDEEETPLRRAIPSQYQKQIVEYDGGYKVGTIVIDTPNKFLYLIQANGKALRYGIGVGRPGFEWAGHKTVSMKREWPDWRPPAQMLKRRPDLPRHMEGGPNNPLGARAMYLGSSLYRIHGTNEPYTIGQAVSSGCIRMTNDDVTDLYSRVKIGTRVVVM